MITPQELKTLKPTHSTSYSALKSRKNREENYESVRASVKHCEGAKAIEEFGTSSGVYLLTLGTVTYVGASTNVRNRKWQHISNLKSNKRQHNASLLQAEWNRLVELGLDPNDHLQFTILEAVEDHTALRPIECGWIHKMWMVHGDNLANTAGVRP